MDSSGNETKGPAHIKKYRNGNGGVWRDDATDKRFRMYGSSPRLITSCNWSWGTDTHEISAINETFKRLSKYLNVKTFASSDSLAKVQEVASWLLEMNQELLSVGSKRRRTGGSLRGNASSSQVDEEQMNRVVEEEEQQQLSYQEEEHTSRNGELVGADPRPGDQSDSQQGHVEENNNRFISVDEDSSGNQEEQEEDEEHAGEQEEEEEEEEEEEMDQESDDFDQSDDSSREDEHTHNSNVTNCSSIVDLPIHQLSSPFYTKTTKRSQGPAASPARSCPHHSLAVGAHQLFDWQEQERSLQEFLIPGYSRTVHFTKPQTESLPHQTVMKIFSISIIAQGLPFCRRR
ncbi:hypothetical protein U0070_003018, partial [Myodes glareolus]